MLSIKRPTPTTVLYTVSPWTSTITSAAIYYARVLAAIALTGRLFYEFTQSPIFPEHALAFLSKVAETISLPTLSSSPALLTSRWHLLSLPILALCILIILPKQTKESLLVLRGLGIQTTTSNPSTFWTFGQSTRFIPTSAIQDIFIHEAFKGFEVKFYLCVVVAGEGEVVVVFPVSSTSVIFGGVVEYNDHACMALNSPGLGLNHYR